MVLAGSNVFLIGAGFSRAVSDEMPLLSELGTKVVSHLDDRFAPTHVRLRPEDFELWLSYLAGDQPWLDEAERLQNRASFLAASRVLAAVVSEHEVRTRSTAIPEWLANLTARWHEDRSTLVTFNYDTLVEAAYTEVVALRLKPGAVQNYVEPAQILKSSLTPIGSRAGGMFSPSHIDTFTLLKLHGSRTWMYSGRSSFFGETIYDAGRIRRWAPDDDDPRPWLSTDKVPLIVPPTAGKTGFFDNEMIQSEWRRAHQALASARHLYIVGYSFPPSDLLVRYLTQDSVSAATKVTVVNPDREVVDRVARMLTTVGTTADLDWIPSVVELAAALPPTVPRPEEIIQH